MAASRKPRGGPKGRRAPTKKQQQQRVRVAHAFEAITGKVLDGEVVSPDARADIASEIEALNSDMGLLAQKYLKGSQKRYYAALGVVMSAVDHFKRRTPAERDLYIKSLGVKPRKGHTIEHILLDYLIQYGGGPGTATASRKLLSRDAKALQQARHYGWTPEQFAERCGKGEAGLDVLARGHSHRLKMEKRSSEGEPGETAEASDQITLAARVPVNVEASRVAKQTRFVAVISCEEGQNGLTAKTVLVRRMRPFEGLSQAELDRVLDQFEDGLAP
jgi:hypothetical protein